MERYKSEHYYATVLVEHEADEKQIPKPGIVPENCIDLDYSSHAFYMDSNGKETEGKPVFSGSRFTRGMYRSGDGRMINADINASLNIIRKSCDNHAFDGVDRNRYRKNVIIWNYYVFYPPGNKNNYFRV